MKRKRSITVLLIATLLLCACQGAQVPDGTASGETSAAETEKETTAAETAATVETQAVTEATAADVKVEEETAAAGSEENRYAFVGLPNYKFTEENFPRMDGSTAAIPMGKAIAQCLLGINEEKAASLCQFNRTTQSFRNLMDGECDILVVGEPNASVYTEMKEAGFGYKQEEIATDALVFVVNESNPVDNLTTQQIRDIYSGKITNWKEVGGEDAEIVAFQRNEGAGSQALIKKLVMQDTELAEAPTEYIIDSMGDLMKAVKNYDNSANAIGYSVYYYANDMKMAKGLKILKVDGIEPSDETIRSRSYPHLNAYYCVIPSKPETLDDESRARAESAQVIYDWLGMQYGQDLIASLGYVSIMESTSAETIETGLSEQITTWNGEKPGTLGALKAGTSYGRLIPYVGDEMMYNYEGNQSYFAGYAYGFLNEKGEMVTDPVYTDITQLFYYDSEITCSQRVSLPMYMVGTQVILGETGDTDDADAEWGDTRHCLVSIDGSFISEKDYAYIEGSSAGVFCMDEYDADTFEFYDFDGKLLFTDQEVRKAISEKLTKEEAESTHWSGIEYANGYFLLSVDSGQYLLNEETLEVVGGPYDSITPMPGGKFRAYVMDGTEDEYHRSAMALDEDQNVLIPAEYTDIQFLENGNMLAVNSDEQKADLYDEKGELLQTISGISNAEKAVYGFRAGIDAGDGYIEATYNADGGLLTMASSYCTEVNVASVPVHALRGDQETGKPFAATGDGKKFLLTQLLTGETEILEGYEYINPLYTGYGNAKLPYLLASSYLENPNHFALIGEDLEIKLEGEGFIYALEDTLNDTWYLLRSNPDETETLLDENLQVVTDGLTGDVSICGGLIQMIRGQTTEVCTLDGETCFRYIHAAAGED